MPETLHALIAARLDGLSAEERHAAPGRGGARQDVHRDGAGGALRDADDELEPLLAALVRKEVLGVQADPRSPEHGQYGFLQDLVRHVAYETLAKRDRKVRHLAAAAHLEQAFAKRTRSSRCSRRTTWPRSTPLPRPRMRRRSRAKTREMLTRAGERAGSIGAPEEGRRYYEQAAALAEDPFDAARLFELAGRLANEANRPVEARERLEHALGVYSTVSDKRATARASVALADVDIFEGRFEEASRRLEQAIADLEAGAAESGAGCSAGSARASACA